MSREERVQAVAEALRDKGTDICRWAEYGDSLDDVAKAAIAAADATRPKLEVTDAMVLAHLNEQQRIGAQDLAFYSLREAVEYLGQGYVDDVRRCHEAALKVTE